MSLNVCARASKRGSSERGRREADHTHTRTQAAYVRALAICGHSRRLSRANCSLFARSASRIWDVIPRTHASPHPLTHSSSLLRLRPPSSLLSYRVIQISVSGPVSLPSPLMHSLAPPEIEAEAAAAGERERDLLSFTSLYPERSARETRSPSAPDERERQRV